MSEQPLDETVLAEAGARLRSSGGPPDLGHIKAAGARRKHMGLRVLGAAASVVALVGVGVMLGARGEETPPGSPLNAEALNPVPFSVKVDALNRVARLKSTPIDPRSVKLTAALNQFGQCDALIDQLRQVGAEHVGSRGFYGSAMWDNVGYRLESRVADTSQAPENTASSGDSTSGETLGTNIQVDGVDEPDIVKAVGTTMYDLRSNRLSIIDTATGTVLGTLDFVSTPGPRRTASADNLLIAGNSVVVFGTETESSEPIAGDQSASVATQQFATVTMIDTSNPNTPVITDHVRFRGSIVDARLVGTEVRLVTGSRMDSIGFVMPTSPESIPRALEANRIALAESNINNWIPTVEHADGGTEALIPCDRVYVPETFAGINMTAMISFSTGTRFAPNATGILAPSTDIFATAERVTVASHIWVDPADQSRYAFDDWKTAVHQFRFAGSAPTYLASTTVDGSVLSQFAFAEVGESLAVVTATGTPWGADPNATVKLSMFNRDSLAPVANLEDIGTRSGVSSVRFTATRAVVALPGTAFAQVKLQVIDLSNPASPRLAGRVEFSGASGYIQPLSETRFAVLSSQARIIKDARGNDEYHQDLQLVDVDTANADQPTITSQLVSKDRYAEALTNHHALTWWASQELLAFGVTGSEDNAARALFVSAASGQITDRAEVKIPSVNAAAPCPVFDTSIIKANGVSIPNGTSILDCGNSNPVHWPGQTCSFVSDEMLASYRAGEEWKGKLHYCSTVTPNVRRVTVLGGVPWINTNQSLMRLDPATLGTDLTVPLA